MKSGTTSLHRYLDLHPEISMSHPKELNFFSNQNNWQKGVEWYESNFSEKAKIRGETSTNYTKFPTFSGVPERMYSVVPDAKLIYLLRDPVERVVSHYIENYASGLEKRDIHRALRNLENNHYLRCSEYYRQLEQYLKYYPASNILIIDSSELRNKRQQTLQKIFRFLGVDDTFSRSEFFEIHRKYSDKKRTNVLGKIIKRIQLLLPPNLKSFIKKLLPPNFQEEYNRITRSPVSLPAIDSQLRHEITEYLKKDVKKLRDYSGEDFSQWGL
jgi:hypothetical protein